MRSILLTSHLRLYNFNAFGAIRLSLQLLRDEFRDFSEGVMEFGWVASACLGEVGTTATAAVS
jgi:hypothetical protein